MKVVTCDLETNALVNPDKIWVAVCRDVETDKVNIFRNLHIDAKEFLQFVNGYDLLVGHNWIAYDSRVLDSFGIRPNTKVVDTLVISRLLNYNRAGGHSLDSWGEHFGVKKSHFGDFSQWSQELEDRCVVDTLLTKLLYNTFSKYLESSRWKKPIEIEHTVATHCVELNTNGFLFDLPKAQQLYSELKPKVDNLLVEFSLVFPSRSKLIKEITPSLTKSNTLHSKDFRWKEDNDLSCFSAGAPFSLIEFVSFNPNSPKQVVERLNEAGWKPTEKTKGHLEAERNKDKKKLAHYATYGWKVSEENLATLPEDAPDGARKLAEYLLLNSRLSDLEEWIGLVRPSESRIHGVYNPIGSWTQRKSHNAPNMANIPALVNRKGQPQFLGKEFRELFRAPDGKVLVGCDAEGIQLRGFAHYCNDEKLIKAVSEGKKEEKTDIHHLNKDVIGTICNSREVAKTYIYAMFLGAQTRKQAEILSCSPKQAKEALRRILEFYPGWKRLKEGQIKTDAARGMFEGLDGRYVLCPGEHYMLAGYLQNFESLVMRYACILWHEELLQKKIPFVFVNDVHDEWQTECYPEHAELIGSIQADSIRKVGEMFKVRCPLAGKYSVGANWSLTH